MNKFEDPSPPYRPLEPSHSLTGTELPNRVIVDQPANIVLLPPVGPGAQRMMCYNCKCQVSTTVITKPNMKTHTMCLRLCPLSILCCCLIPYCFDSCKSQHHYCPNCNTYLGTFSN